MNISNYTTAHVNRLLRTVGLLPVQRLDSGDPDVSTAISVLMETDEQLQAEGWYFNTELYPMLYRNAGNEIVLPANYLDARLQTNQYTARDGKLYDLHARSFKFTEDVQAETMTIWVGLKDAPAVFVTACLAAAEHRLYLDLEGTNATARELEKGKEAARITLKQRHLQRQHNNALNNTAAGRLMAGVPNSIYGRHVKIVGGNEWLLNR